MSDGLLSNWSHIFTRNEVTSWRILALNHRLSGIIRDISDQELISCLHDQPRSCTFSTGDLLFVYTQLNENEQHILWFDIYILYINLCDWQTKGIHLFKIKDTFATQWDIVWFMNVSSWCIKCYPRSMDLNKRSQCIILLEQNVQYGVRVLTVNHHNYSNISARRWARAAHSSTKCDMLGRLYKKKTANIQASHYTILACAQCNCPHDVDVVTISCSMRLSAIDCSRF